MTSDGLKMTRLRVVGARETLKKLAKRAVKTVYVAKDAQRALIEEVLAASERQGIPIEFIDTMEALGQMCGIEVPAVCAAVLKTPKS